MRELDLCGKCAAELAGAYILKKQPCGVDNKVTCDACGKRRFGATYTVDEPRRKEDAVDGQ